MQERQGNLLFIDDEPEMLKSLKRQFRKNYNVYLANSADEGYRLMKEQDIQVVISDQRMPKMTGTEFFKKIKAEFPDTMRLILTAYADVNAVIVAVNDGNVFHYLTKPWDPINLEIVIDKAFQQYWLTYNNKKLMTELQETNAILQQQIKERKRSEIAKEAAEAANQVKTAFLANMSHEFRTPLNAILGFTQIIMHSSPPVSAENLEYLNTIHRSGEHLLTLISQVLDLAKLETGQTTFTPIEFNLYHLIAELRDLFQQKADKKELKFQIDYDRNVPQYIFTDAVKLRQVLINLLDNAFKFTEIGSVNLFIQNTTTQKFHTKGFTPTDNPHTAVNQQSVVSLTFKINDTGRGIAPTDIGLLFEAFEQTKTGRQSQEGTKLGLPITKKFVELLGGKLIVESTPIIEINNSHHQDNQLPDFKSGSTFTFTIQCEVINPNQHPTLAYF